MLLTLASLAAGCSSGGGGAGGSGGNGSGGAGSGGATGSGGAVGSGGAGTGGAMGSGGAGGAMADASGSGGSVGSGGTSVDAGADSSDAGSGTDTAGDDSYNGNSVLACWPDKTVIRICHQLENACENCPPGGAPPGNQTAARCFALIAKAYAGTATDADCVKFAVDNRCTVDNGGNVCGTLGCNTAGCKDKARCLNRQQWGDTTMCTEFVATCPCGK